MSGVSKYQSSTGSWGVSSGLRLIVSTGHSACFQQNSLTVPTKTLQKTLNIIPQQHISN